MLAADLNERHLDLNMFHSALWHADWIFGLSTLNRWRPCTVTTSHTVRGQGMFPDMGVQKGRRYHSLHIPVSYVQECLGHLTLGITSHRVFIIENMISMQYLLTFNNEKSETIIIMF